MARRLPESVMLLRGEAGETDTASARYKATQIGADINKVQKEIGQLKKVCAACHVPQGVFD